MERCPHGFLGELLSDTITGKLLGDAARKLTPESFTHVERLCASRGLVPVSYLRWWLEANGKAPMYRNIVMSPKTDSRFLEWVDSQRTMAATDVKLQIDELGVRVKTSFVSPEKLFSRGIRGISPLVHFTMARYLGYPRSVEWLLEEAVEEARAKPWIAEQLVKFNKSPESEKCRQTMKQIT